MVCSNCSSLSVVVIFIDSGYFVHHCDAVDGKDSYYLCVFDDCFFPFYAFGACVGCSESVSVEKASSRSLVWHLENEKDELNIKQQKYVIE